MRRADVQGGGGLGFAHRRRRQSTRSVGWMGGRPPWRQPEQWTWRTTVKMLSMSGSDFVITDAATGVLVLLLNSRRVASRLAESNFDRGGLVRPRAWGRTW
jgi:hypothetical protein